MTIAAVRFTVLDDFFVWASLVIEPIYGLANREPRASRQWR